MMIQTVLSQAGTNDTRATEMTIATETAVGLGTNDPDTAAAHLDATGPKTVGPLIDSSERTSQTDAAARPGIPETPTSDAMTGALQTCGLQ